MADKGSIFKKYSIKRLNCMKKDMLLKLLLLRIRAPESKYFSNKKESPKQLIIS